MCFLVIVNSYVATAYVDYNDLSVCPTTQEVSCTTSHNIWISFSYFLRGCVGDDVVMMMHI